jgi:hypothetical protein
LIDDSTSSCTGSTFTIALRFYGTCHYTQHSEHVRYKAVLGGYHNIPFGITQISPEHFSRILSGHRHEWYPDWKPNYQFWRVWEQDVRTDFFKKKKKIWEPGKVWPFTRVRVSGCSCSENLIQAMKKKLWAWNIVLFIGSCRSFLDHGFELWRHGVMST